MKKAIILHGTQGSPEGNWFRWLEAKLRDKDMEVWLPQLPHAEQPSLLEWLSFVQENCPFEIDEETAIIGHSSGSILSLISAQESHRKIGGVICVSVFHNNSLGWEANARLFDVEFKWMKIRTNVKKQIVCIHSDDDPYVPLDQAQYVANRIGAEMIIIPNQGHFNLEKSPTYVNFSGLLDIAETRKLL